MPFEWTRLSEACGGRAALCEEGGFTEMSLWRWANGRREIPERYRLKLAAVAKRHGVPSPAPAPTMRVSELLLDALQMSELLGMAWDGITVRLRRLRKDAEELEK